MRKFNEKKIPKDNENVDNYFTHKVLTELS